MRPLIISLTTIPPRFGKIGKTLRDLRNQSAPVSEIRLNVSRRYRRYPEHDTSISPDVPDGITIVFTDEDLGPATKVLPTVQDYRGQDVEILFCDDDQAYDKHWAGRFLKDRGNMKDACIAETGSDLSASPQVIEEYQTSGFLPRAQRRRKTLTYRIERLARLGTRRPNPFVGAGFVHILKGYRGAMIRPGFFSDVVFRIPEILWTVDDVWLSGNLAVNGVPIWVSATAPAWRHPYVDGDSQLLRTVYRGHGRQDANRLCVEYFQKTYGIWGGALEVAAGQAPSDVHEPGLTGHASSGEDAAS